MADAAMAGDLDTIRSLLQDGADVNASQGDGMSALHWAAMHGDGPLARVLLYAGANHAAITRLGGYTPLHLAAQAGSGAVIEALLEAGSDPRGVTLTGATTALHFAAASGSAHAVARLVSSGAVVDARESQWGQTPLMFAAALDRVEAVKTLLDLGADPSLLAHVVDVAAREASDRADQRLRSRRVAAIREVTEQLGVTPPPTPRRIAAGAPSEDPAAPAERAPEEQLLGTTEIDPFSYAGLVGTHGGLSALLLAVREGHEATVRALLDGGANINQMSAADRTSPLLLAAINGHYDLVLQLLGSGADASAASDSGATPLYAVLNTEWIPKSRHPQPTDYRQQEATYRGVMEALLQAGADPNARLEKTLWYTTYNNDLLRVDRAGATPFWRAAFATDVPAMRLLVSYGADPSLPTVKVRDRGRRSGAEATDPSGLAPVPVGGAAVYPIHAASGVGYGQGYAANSHRHVPDGWLPAVRYLVEELGADVNARDVDGYSAVHHAAARGDNELIKYLVEHGADVTLVSRRGQTTVDMANGPVQRIQPFPQTIALLEQLGATNNHNCVSC